MKTLLIFILIVGVICTVSLVSHQVFPSSIPFLIFMISFLLLFPLMIVSLIFAMRKWRKYRLCSIIPFAVALGFIPLSLLMGHLGYIIATHKAPCSPERYFTEEKQQELTVLAESLLNLGIKNIRAYPSESIMIDTADDLPVKDLPRDAIEKLKHDGFVNIYVDDTQGIVQLGYVRSREWYEYIYARDGLSLPYSMPSLITAMDIEDWDEMVRIAKTGNNTSEQIRGTTAFQPTIVYPMLEQGIGKPLIDKLLSLQSAKSLTTIEKQSIIDALNQQRLVASALIENPEIRYTGWDLDGSQKTGIMFANYHKISDSFWVTRLLKQLIDQGIIIVVDDQGHVKIKTELSADEKLMVEWLHIGIMNFAYGNFLDKRIYPFENVLSKQWYFYRF